MLKNISKKIFSKKYFSQNIKSIHYFHHSNGKTGFENRENLYLDKDFMKKASYWHDIPCKSSENNELYNFVIEIPKGTTAKMEMCKNETHNPIKQDVKKNKITGEEYLRHYKLVPTFNYGFIPQTWENNKIMHYGKYVGDNDPIDVVEVSESRFTVGDITSVHIIGSFCLIDENEIDWKILAINKDSHINYPPGEWLREPINLARVKDIMHWFRTYKTFDGKPENTIHENKLYSIPETLSVIEQNYEYYKNLIYK